jgi:ribosome biogenesis GTPase A
MEVSSLQIELSNFAALEKLAIDSDAPNLASETRALAERIRDGLFYVACVGQFKRGKSTLLNALVGSPILPTGVTPVTAVVTVIRHGNHTAARIRFANGDWQEIAPGELALFVTEDENPENRKGVAVVEVFLPSELLAAGMCLVDTPGIGSVFVGNTEAVRAFVPHIDAALVVLGTDPPISADELALITDIRKQCEDLLFVFNKADKFTDLEREVAGKFTRQVLRERANLDGIRLFEVSAMERLEGRGPERGWAELSDALRNLAQKKGGLLVRIAGERGLALLSDRLRRYLEEQRGALLRPVEESERRVETLRTYVNEAEQALNDLGYLFTAEQDRLARIFEDWKEEFLKQAQPGARRELIQAIRAIGPCRGPVLREKSYALTDPISKKWLDKWRAEVQPKAEILYVEAMRRFADLANGFLEKLAASDESALAGLPRKIAPETGFTYRSRLYYTSLITLTSQTPLGWFLDLIRPRKRQLQALDRQVGEYLETIIFANANRIVNDFDDRVLESRRIFQAHIRAALDEIVASAEKALMKAKEYHARGSQAIHDEVERINMLSGRLKALSLEGKDTRS